ncbi:MAG: hypothetical protein IKE55_09890 [Kiritimatiellae bacterium]|nr:hypothetical protein [Kiritimatiellia bacterium]
MRRAPQRPDGIASLTVGRADPAVLQDFLARRFSLSRRAAKAMIDGRSVWVNRTCVWIAGHRLRVGDRVELPERVVNGARSQGRASRTAAPVAAAAPAKRHVRVLVRSGRYLVCDKPAGMLSCGSPDSVESVLRGQESMPGLKAVHRLDRDTTGCMVLAADEEAFQAAVEVFKTHRVAKVYHAIAVGRFPHAHYTVDSPIDGQQAVSRIAREAVSADASFLRVRIETGRTNQIRRHLASIRFPVVGDRTFGLKSARDPRLMQVPRLMLHASSIELPNPLEPGSSVKAHSPLPADFRAALRLFGMGKRR